MDEGLGDAFETDVLVLDSGSLGACGTGAVNVEQITKAVRHLQKEGLKVILVRDQAVAERLREVSTAFDGSSLLHVPSLSGTNLDTLKVAEKYECFFLTNEDVVALEDDWRLPRRCQRWLRRCRSHLHVRFSFDDKGVFRADWPLKATRRAKGAKSAHGLPSPSSGRPSSACDTPSVQPKVQKPSQILRGSSLESSSVLDCEALKPEGEWPPVIVLKPRSSNAVSPIICISCEDPRVWLFPHAADLVMGITQADLTEDEEDTYLLKELRQANAGDLFTAVSATSGRHKGLVGVGLGSKQKSRKRAARLALAAYAKVVEGGPMENPSGDGEFMLLVDTVRALLSGKSKDGSDSANQNNLLPPPPPPGAPPQAARQMPPPPPPPVEEVDSGVLASTHNDAAMSSGRSAQPPEITHDQTSDPAASSAPSADPADGSRTEEQLLEWLKAEKGPRVLPSNGQPQPRTNLGFSGPRPQHRRPTFYTSLHRPAQSTIVDFKWAMAIASYQAEGDGYLSLSYGDILELLHDRVQPASATDVYPRYAYGQVISEHACYRARMTGHEPVGWFPFDLCESLPYGLPL